MGKTISFVKGKGSLAHNNRDFVADNVDTKRMGWNRYYIQQPLREAYEALFGEAIVEYNSKQKRKDRLITDYLTDIKNSGNNEKQFYEIVVQIGKKEDTGVLDGNGAMSAEAETAMKILDEYVKTFQERNPNLYLFNAVLHMDEATPHLHMDYIPVAHGYKSKMHTRNSLTKALQEMGIEPATSRLDTETIHWQAKEREYIQGLCREHNLEIEVLGDKRDNYTIPEYKAARQAADELAAELEILHAERQEMVSEIERTNIEAAEAKENVEEGRHQLAEINEQIADREKRCREYEEKMDKVLGAEKETMKELAVIRNNTKKIPAILGSEPSVKMPQEDFEQLMKIAKASGTLAKLNEIYERELGKLKSQIDRITNQVKTLKEKISNFEEFINWKGLTEEFKAFIPKSAIRLLQRKKEETAEAKLKHNKVRVRDGEGVSVQSRSV